MVELNGSKGREQSGVRPAVIIQNNAGNKHSPTTIIAPMTSKTKRNIPTHIHLNSQEGGLQKDSTILCEQITVIDKERLLNKIGSLSNNVIDEINKKICVSLGI